MVAIAKARCMRRGKALGRGVRVGARRERGAGIDQRTGFIGQDNSEKGNIFGLEPKTLYSSSPRAEAAKKEGIGGALGVLITVGVLAAGAFSLGTLVKVENEAAPPEQLDTLSSYVQKLK